MFEAYSLQLTVATLNAHAQTSQVVLPHSLANIYSLRIFLLLAGWEHILKGEDPRLTSVLLSSCDLPIAAFGECRHFFRSLLLERLRDGQLQDHQRDKFSGMVNQMRGDNETAS
jgi:hypothetical protein